MTHYSDVKSNSPPGFGIMTALGLLVLCALAIAYAEGLAELLKRWRHEDEYSHGFLLLPLALYLFLQRGDEVISRANGGSWLGVVIVLFASMLFLVGELSAMYLFVHYALVATVFGFALAAYGGAAIRPWLFPFAILLFCIPIPYFFQATLTAKLQLMSSRLGVQFIELMGIPAYLEGNRIDLGVYQLQVVEACAGLRYLFALLSFGFICAVCFRVEWWKRALIFFLVLPISLLMNSVRIAAVGLLVHHFGIETAEGLVHEFEGIVIFVGCLLILWLAMMVLVRVGRSRGQSLSEVFHFNVEPGSFSAMKRAWLQYRSPVSLLVCFVIALLCVLSWWVLKDREAVVPERRPLVVFPGTLAHWQGEHLPPMSQAVIDNLQVSDYLQMDFQHSDGLLPINLYVAYYDAQKKGVSPHSPKVCIPGGGWEISNIQRMKLELGGESLSLNRALIQRGSQRQLVYYWFQQRGHSIANEYKMKVLLFRDALFENRTDGALVRLSSVVGPNQTVGEVEQNMQGLLREIWPVLPDYVPN